MSDAPEDKRRKSLDEFSFGKATERRRTRMLQRQQADAIISARTRIVDGAVGMVKMALDKLKDDGVVDLDEERKAQMTSNLLVVLCSERGTSPIVNAGRSGKQGTLAVGF